MISQRRKLSSDQAWLGPYSLAEDMFIKTQTGKIGQLTKLPETNTKREVKMETAITETTSLL